MNPQDKLAAVINGPWGWRIFCLIVTFDALLAAYLAYSLSTP